MKANKASANNPPDVSNSYHQNHVSILLDNLKRWTGLDLAGDCNIPVGKLGKRVYEADFYLLSHDETAEAILNYANKKALDLWEMTWEELTSAPARNTAKPDDRGKRDEVMHRVNEKNFIEGYSGIRVSKSGREFLIKNVTIWNVFSEDGKPYGRAAWFREIEYI